MITIVPFDYHTDYHVEKMQAVDESIKLVHQLALELQQQQSSLYS